ncbi:hypothetical protein GLOIN_2v1493952, partial [Rhizophagus irregularis DAOM 181602=DAOM 197198]
LDQIRNLLNFGENLEEVIKELVRTEAKELRRECAQKVKGYKHSYLLKFKKN